MSEGASGAWAREQKRTGKGACLVLGGLLPSVLLEMEQERERARVSCRQQYQRQFEVLTVGALPVLPLPLAASGWHTLRRTGTCHRGRRAHLFIGLGGGGSLRQRERQRQHQWHGRDNARHGRGAAPVAEDHIAQPYDAHWHSCSHGLRVVHARSSARSLAAAVDPRTAAADQSAESAGFHFEFWAAGFPISKFGACLFFLSSAKL